MENNNKKSFGQIVSKYIEQVTEIPMTFNGKIDRKKTISLYSN